MSIPSFAVFSPTSYVFRLSSARRRSSSSPCRFSLLPIRSSPHPYHPLSPPQWSSVSRLRSLTTPLLRSVTSTPGAFVGFTFPSTSFSVSLFGSIGPNHAPYAVFLNNIPMGNFSSKRSREETKVMLFHADGLGSASGNGNASGGSRGEGEGEEGQNGVGDHVSVVIEHINP